MYYFFAKREEWGRAKYRALLGKCEAVDRELFRIDRTGAPKRPLGQCQRYGNQMTRRQRRALVASNIGNGMVRTRLIRLFREANLTGGG